MPELCAEDGSLALREIRKMWPWKSWRKGPQEERRAGGGSWVLRHLSSPPHARLQCLTGWHRGTGSLFLPQNIWGCIRHNDLVKKIVMEICNRETLSKASLKFLSTPSRVEGIGNWKTGRRLQDHQSGRNSIQSAGLRMASRPLPQPRRLQTHCLKTKSTKKKKKTNKSTASSDPGLEQTNGAHKGFPGFPLH